MLVCNPFTLRYLLCLRRLIVVNYEPWYDKQLIAGCSKDLFRFIVSTEGKRRCINLPCNLALQENAPYAAVVRK